MSQREEFAVVTGSSTGIGFETSLALARMESHRWRRSLKEGSILYRNIMDY